MIKTLLPVLSLSLGLSVAHAVPFAAGNAAHGKELVEKSCASCHTALYGGDGSKMYTRPERKIKSAEQLASQVKSCNSAAGADWSAAEQSDAAAFLNQRYYHFK